MRRSASMLCSFHPETGMHVRGKQARYDVSVRETPLQFPAGVFAKYLPAPELEVRDVGYRAIISIEVGVIHHAGSTRTLKS